MVFSMLSNHSRGKVLQDAIFAASTSANLAINKYGFSKVVNGTIGAIIDDNGNLVCINTVEETFRNVPTKNLAGYAPITGTKDFNDAVLDVVFGDNRPEGYIASISTSGGTGAIYNALYNYTDIGDTVLTSDWFWGTYSSICTEFNREFATYNLFDEHLNYNIKALEEKVNEILHKKDNLFLIINTPAHNPTGYSLSLDEWDSVLDFLKKKVADKNKRITLLVDIAYIDYAGEKNEVRKFMKKFSNLPSNILSIFAFSMSKGHTLYGQRAGAMVAVSRDKSIIDEFVEATKFTSRCTWSNINHAAMTTLATINNDKTLKEKYEQEREELNEMIRKRAKVFMEEAKECGLRPLPYKGGFFISVPCDNSKLIADKLQEDNIFIVPLKKGLRIAACSISEEKMHNLAKKTLDAMNFIKNK